MEGFLQWKSFCNGRILHCKHSKIENYTTRWDSYFTLKMDRKRKAVFLRLFENSRKRRKAADEEIDRMIESLEDSADDEYQEEDEENMIGAISYAFLFFDVFDMMNSTEMLLPPSVEEKDHFLFFSHRNPDGSMHWLPQ